MDKPEIDKPEMDKPPVDPPAEARPFWEGCTRGELLYQRCAGCGRVQFYPRAACTGCGATALEWHRSAGFGTIHTFTIVRRAPSAAFRSNLPYVLALVDMDEGFRMMLNLRRSDPESAHIGQRVTIVFEPQPRGWTLPQAVPA